MIEFNLTTQGIKYAGAKTKLLPHILSIAHDVGAKTVLDGFSGSTRVSQAFVRNGFSVIANDIAVWSKTLNQCFLLSRKPRSYYADLIAHLNGLAPAHGWFTEHYGGYNYQGSSVQHDGLKKPWQVHNTQKLDAIRTEIDALHLSECDKAVAITSVILALDKVDSTLGHYVSYLKEWSPRSYHTMQLEIPDIIDSGNIYSDSIHHVYNEDVCDVVKRHCVDLAYFDPPYGSNNEKMPPSRVRYASYYHLWTTICLNDTPTLFGKAKRRLDTSDTFAPSPFESFKKNEMGRFIAVEAIEQLLCHTQARFVLLSYSSGGRATAEELRAALSRHGIIRQVLEVSHRKNVMAAMKWTHDWVKAAAEPHKEFLFLLETHSHS